MITVARIDERLIHGQVSYAWTTAYKSEAVMAVDAEAARDQMQVSLLKMACPAGLKCFVADEKRAAELLAKHARRKIFVVAKHPDAYLRLIELGADIPSINVGGLYFQEGRRQVSRTVYVDEHMEQAFRALAQNGVRLEVRTPPRDAEENLMDLL